MVKDSFLAIVNPAAGGGRAAKFAGDALARLKAAGLRVDVIASTGPGHASQLAAEACAQGYRKFLAVGGDGTAHEIINGAYNQDDAARRIELGFLPMGTGNSFLARFHRRRARSLPLKRLSPAKNARVDLLRLRHSTGTIYSFNLLSVGFTADVGALTNRIFKPFGHLGYLLGVFVRVVQLKRRGFKMRCDSTIAIGTSAAACFSLSTTPNSPAAP